jgi:hypothetical protein
MTQMYFKIISADWSVPELVEGDNVKTFFIPSPFAQRGQRRKKGCAILLHFDKLRDWDKKGTIAKIPNSIILLNLISYRVWFLHYKTSLGFIASQNLNKVIYTTFELI